MGGRAWTPDLGDEFGNHFGDLGDKSMIPENATFFLDISIRKENTFEYTRKLHVTSRPAGGDYIRSALESRIPQFPEGVIFQQDGAPPHYGNIVREFLDTTFPQRWIGRGAVMAWPPRSPDITPLDFYLWVM
ncbi:hypothetical protein AVEN_119075-1 [Araneus ventricosus]|uniref:Tc1-like transposase DDE domain-containing protein n=1 Tax=Araneus ventricosus TaxID=182803 RepID=A0A4Y2BMN2_ARAVE|nr:hypothetical protein AVEN_119075-1 [Araneus ventricosus]